jgi:hypothetical protein
VVVVILLIEIIVSKTSKFTLGETMKAPDEEQRYSSTLSLTSAFEGVGG